MINLQPKRDSAQTNGAPSHMVGPPAYQSVAPHSSLGEILVESGAVSQDVVRKALKRQRRDRRLVGELLREMGVESEAVTRAVGKQLGIPTADLTLVGRNDDVGDLFTDAFSRQNRVLPLYIDANS